MPVCKILDTKTDIVIYCDSMTFLLTNCLKNVVLNKTSVLLILLSSLSAMAQVKKSILEEEIYCPPEASVLLASYAVHAKVSTPVLLKTLLALIHAQRGVRAKP